MSELDVIQYIFYGVLGLVGWIIRNQWVKIEKIRDDVTKVQIELTKQKQENSELYNNIRRIDINIDKLFDKIEHLITIVSKPQKK